MKKQTGIVAVVILVIVVIIGGYYGYQRYSLSKNSNVPNTAKVDKNVKEAKDAVDKATSTKSKEDISKAREAVNKLSAGEIKDSLAKRIYSIDVNADKANSTANININDKADKVKLDVDNTTLLGFSFLKISFDQMNKDGYVVKYDGNNAAWSAKFNCFVLKYEGKKVLSEFDAKKVSVEKKAAQ
ncbi:hypothetical protein [Clostridium drakei]|uniref:Uncharacterized protein n=1 Tax=Clostridium drakei TaxID=332101 RepID=A0A2U8DKB1_9CLOT|nr:hypothetical protein [Clostridium drakei]AWI03137.1 hypothetical protein B9W14_00980 [Clostridium drakei]